MSDKRIEERQGLVSASLSYLLWGILPIYWRELRHVGSDEVVTHRGLWSVAFLLPFVVYRGGVWRVFRLLRTPAVLRSFLFSTVLLGSHWVVYIWGVNNGYAVQCSFGYFLLPFFSIALGRFFLGERLVGLQRVAFAVAAFGVLLGVVLSGTVPWIGLVLAATFSVYGYLQKIGRFDAIEALFVETVLLAPFAVAYLLFLEGENKASFLQGNVHTDLLLILAGAVTAVPLILYGYGARRIPLMTLGWLWYVNPTMQLLAALLVFGEPLRPATLVAFLFVWAAIGILLFDSIKRSRKSAVATAESLNVV
jgi:chloramphenicol-sensitive protein RarD